MRGIELEVAWHTEESAKLEDLGIQTPLIKDCEKRLITFYQIDHIRPYQDDDNEWYCVVISGGQNYTTFKTYKEIKRLIEE